MEQIYDILKISKLKCAENNNIGKVNNNINNGSYFNILSTTSVSHICSYLNRYDIRCFKLTCSMLGIICINEMRKIKIGTINFNEILSHSNYKYLTKLNEFSTHKLIKYNSYNPKTYARSLLSLWSQTYDIPLNDIILFKIVDDALFLSQRYQQRQYNNNHYYQNTSYTNTSSQSSAGDHSMPNSLGIVSFNLSDIEVSPTLTAIPQSRLPVIYSESSHSYHIYNDNLLNSSITDLQFDQGSSTPTISCSISTKCIKFKYN